MAKKKKTSKFPKRIAGVKVPKPLRRSLNDVLASKLGRDIVADALVAAGAALLGSQTSRGSPTRRFLRDHGPHHLADDARDVGGGLNSSRQAFAYALGEASRTFAEALHRGKAEADARAAWPPAAEAEEDAPRKKPGAGREASPAH